MRLRRDVVMMSMLAMVYFDVLVGARSYSLMALLAFVIRLTRLESSGSRKLCPRKHRESGITEI